MAYAEQEFTNLGAVQAPNPALSETFAGANFDAFKISDQTNQLLNQVSQEAVAKRENEVKQFNANLQTALGKASQVYEGLNPQDYEVAKTKSNDAIKYLYDNMEILSGKSPEKQRKFNEMLVDISTFAQLSKGTKKVEDTYNEFVKKDTDWNNPVNNYYLAEYRKGTPQEKAQKAFTPIKNTETDFLTVDLPKFQANTGVEVTETIADPNDAGSNIVVTKKTYDPELFRNWYKARNGQYLTEEWKVLKAQGDANVPDTPEEYINMKADVQFVPEKVTGKAKVYKNQEFSETQKNERNDASIEGRATEGQANREARIEAAKQKASIKNASYELVNDGEYKINRMLEGKQPIEGSEAVKKVYKDAVEVYRIDTDVPPEISNKLYSTKNGAEYGVLYEVVPKNGSPYYLKATTINLDKKGKILPKNAPKEDIVSVSVIPDINNKYSKDALLENVVGASQKGKAQLEEYRKANNELKTIESEVNTKTTPKSASAEKQLENPKVNQLLKTSYQNLKQKYPTIDTNGIAGDAAHKQRDSDHNTMDAIDIVNFGDKSSSIIADLQKDGNVKYVIFNKQIWNPKEGWKPYTGKNPHKDHIHVSYKDDGITEVKKTTTKGKYKFNPTTGKLELQ